MRSILLAAALVLGNMPGVLAGPTLAIAPITYDDTSGEPAKPGVDRPALLKALEEELGRDLAEGGTYAIQHVAGPDCSDNAPDCAEVWAKSLGTDLVLVGSVLKTSTLISHFWIGIFKGDGKTRLLFRDMQFRGDNEEAWVRAGRFLARQVVAAKPGL